MKALVAVAGHILLVDLQTAAVQIVETKRGNYYGISWWADSDYPVLIHDPMRGESIEKVSDLYRTEQSYISVSNKLSPKFLTEPHQLVCAPNGWVIIADTGRNRIVLYNPTNDFYKTIKISDPEWDRLGPGDTRGDHVNSVYVKHGKLYALAHGFEKTAYLLEYSFPEGELLNKRAIKYRTGLHNLWLDDANRMFACHSAAGEIIELNTNEVIWRGSAFYSRGLSVTKDIIIVGDSERALRKDRDHLQSGLWIIDRKSLQTLDFIPLGSYGSLLEVRVLDEPDEAHHGIPFKDTELLLKRNYLHERRQEKLQSQKLLQDNNFINQIDFIIGFVEPGENGWLRSREDETYRSRMIAIAKKQPKYNYKLSIEYAFFASDIHDEQYFSLMTGYKGNHDNNMVAIFLHYTKEKACHLYLWKNENNTWKEAEVLLPVVENQGKLEVTRQGDKLLISCNGSKAVERNLETHELAGDVGFRCQGAHFRNFSVAEH